MRARTLPSIRRPPVSMASPGRGRVQFLVRAEAVDVVGDLAALHLAVGRDEEAVLVDLRVDAQRGDQADVRAFRRLDRADPAVVRDVDVAHFEAGPLAVQAAGSQRRQSTLVRQHRERVRLVDDLRELAAAEEEVDRARDALGVDEIAMRLSSSGSLTLIRSWTVRRSFRKPLRISSTASSSSVRRRRLPRWSMSSTCAVRSAAGP